MIVNNSTGSYSCYLMKINKTEFIKILFIFLGYYICDYVMNNVFATLFHTFINFQILSQRNKNQFKTIISHVQANHSFTREL